MEDYGVFLKWGGIDPGGWPWAWSADGPRPRRRGGGWPLPDLSSDRIPI